MVVPIYGVREGDVVVLVVTLNDDDTVSALSEVVQRAAAVRVAPLPAADVVHRGKRLDPDLTIAGAGLRALDRVDVVPRSADPSVEAAPEVP